MQPLTESTRPNCSGVLVLGGGVIGLAIADEIARRGCKVALVERDVLIGAAGNARSDNWSARSAAAWAAAGILPPANFDSATDPIDRLRGLCHRLYPDWIARLCDETGIDPQLIRCGGWYLADTVGETAAMSAMVAYWRDLSIECERMTVEQLVDSEPALGDWVKTRSAASQIVNAWWVPDEYQVRTPRLLTALIQSCLNQNVHIIDQHRVVSIDEADRETSVRAIDTSGNSRTLIASKVIACGGTWTGLMGDRLRLSQSLVPVRGQMLLLQSDAAMLRSVINVGHRYLVPRRDGQVLVGSCEEEVGFQHGTTPAILQELRQFALELCPSLSAAREVASWSGLRPMTFDGFPMCGNVPGSQCLYVASGHFRSGIHLAPGTAKCMADLITGDLPPLELEPFRVGKQQMQSS